ncbi:MAG: hypothetical protein IKK14_05875 [Oscillospiraceae bacterium]|nr:hypothetical protein [Oscillospiraceae bacterium]
MINLWLSNKMRFVANLLFVVFGIGILALPWFVSLLALALALVFDYSAFSFSEKTSLLDKKSE